MENGYNGKYVSVQELFVGSQVTTIAEDVRAEVSAENSGPRPFSQTPAGRVAVAWSGLANKVIGAEGD